MRAVAGLCAALLLVVAGAVSSSAAAPAATITVTVDTSKRAGVTTNPLSPAVTLDFWRSDDHTYGQKWGNSSAISIDLDNPQLNALAAQLSPALLRLGGSPEDSVIFDADGTCVPQSGGDGPFPGYYCSQVKPYSYDCLTAARWDRLLRFGHDNGLQIVLGLNGCYGRANKTAPMDLSNVAAIMQATASSPYASALWGFELTNEVVPMTIDPAAWSADLVSIRAMATTIFGNKGLPTPSFAGPDTYTLPNCQEVSDVVATTPAGTAAAYTYHQYPQCVAPPAGGSARGFLMDPACLTQLDTQAQQCVAAAGSPPQAAVWAGETADHSGGGIANLTDTFRSSFYYAWQLAALPLHGVELAARQCLSGGDYELLQRYAGFAPNPDYWLAWMFKQTIGGGAGAFTVTADTPVNVSGVRVFAFTAKGSSSGSSGRGTTAAGTSTGTASAGPTYALLVLNLNNPAATPAPHPVTLNLQGTGIAGVQRTEYHLSGDATLAHGAVAVNGVTLAVSPPSYTPPSLASLGQQANGPMTVAPGTIVFATM